MDTNLIIVKPSRSSQKKNFSLRKIQSSPDPRSTSRASKKGKDKKFKIKDKDKEQQKSPDQKFPKEGKKKRTKYLLPLSKVQSTKEEAESKSKSVKINDILQEDDKKILDLRDLIPKRPEPALNLQKRPVETYLGQGKSFIKIENNEEDDEDQIDKKKKGIEDLEQVFGQLKKVKKETDVGTSSRDPSFNARTLQSKNLQPSTEVSEKLAAPWMTSSTSKIENPIIRFHNEVIDFYEYIGPSKKDQATRKKSFEKLSQIIIENLPHATVKPFGSYVTNLYLPQSDIDVAVIEPTLGAQALLNKIAKAFMKHEDYESINVIRSAKVPLVKVVERSTGLHFDISFNKLDGVNQVKEIQKALDYYPEMKYIILVIKCFLKQRDLNETFQGGIGSFLLFCLVLAYLRENRKDYADSHREDEVDKILLSEYILKFLDYFANFDYVRKQILIAGGGGIVNKYMRSYGFSVISPQDENHDIGSAAFRIKEVFGIFKNRYHFLVNYNFKKGESVLKYLIDGNLLK